MIRLNLKHLMESHQLVLHPGEGGKRDANRWFSHQSSCLGPAHLGYWKENKRIELYIFIVLIFPMCVVWICFCTCVCTCMCSPTVDVMY